MYVGELQHFKLAITRDRDGVGIVLCIVNRLFDSGAYGFQIFDFVHVAVVADCACGNENTDDDDYRADNPTRYDQLTFSSGFLLAFGEVLCSFAHNYLLFSKQESNPSSDKLFFAFSIFSSSFSSA